MNILVQNNSRILLIAVNSAEQHPRADEFTTVTYFEKDGLYSDKNRLVEVHVPLPFKEFVAMVEAAQKTGHIPDATPEGVTAYRRSLAPAKLHPLPLRRDFTP